jgi:glucose/arabinose dehydrogenase/plastocyanin
MKFLSFAVAVSLGFSLAVLPSAHALELQQGDHVALIGDGLADRFQHSSWLETYIYARYPKLDLVFRDLAVTGDEVATRHRPSGFGSADEWLTRVQADVIFAFFGFNESFKGEAGLAKFKGDLDHFLKETAGKNYSGKGHPRVVLFSPIANEKMHNPNYPDPTANNANIAKYTEAMAEVARANGVEFVDLFKPSKQLFADAFARGQSLTINGIHLSDAGDELIAQAIVSSLWGRQAIDRQELKGADFEKLRDAVKEKNFQWEERYRTIDGNNVYGGRSTLAYAPGKRFVDNKEAPPPFLSNYKVMQEEMAQRDQMTANRDKRIWALANGRDAVVDDSNLPPVEAVPTDMPGSNPDGSWTYLSGEEAIAKMKVHSHMKVNLFASEAQFPELVSPVQMAWDTKGRLWVAAWKNYPERTPGSKIGDSLIVLEDTDGDGKADKVTHFIDDLNGPTGFQFYKNGVLLMEAPDLWFLPDNNGKAGPVERVLMGLASGDSHHTANAMCLDPGGAVYLSDGVFHRTQVETADGPVRNFDGAIYRFEPDTGKFETYVSYNFANPHGRVFDYWGNDLITDATGNETFFGPAFSGHIDFPAKHKGMEQFWARPSRPCPGTGMISSDHFPPELQGCFLNCNVIGFQGIYMVKVNEEGSGLKGQTIENLVSSSDPNFRPCDVNIGPDGAIYFADWHKPLIGHMQHHLRDPNREQEHGRIYRITYEGRELLKQPKIDGQPVEALLDLLKAHEDRTRLLAKIELGKHDSKEVIAATDKWAAGLDANDPAHEHHLLEALWVHQWHNIVDTNLLYRLLHSPEPRARAAAGRVLCYWRDRIPQALSWFKVLADDENPRTRLEAVRGASFFRKSEAADVALTILKHSTDYYLNYTLDETLRQLKPWWLEALTSGKGIGNGNAAGQEHLMNSLSTPELLKMKHSQAVLAALVQRRELPDPDRLNDLAELARMNKRGAVEELFALFGSKIEGDDAAPASLARLLPWQPAAELKADRAHLEQLATSSQSPDLRRAAWASIARADNSFDRVWGQASGKSDSLADLLEGIPLLNDASFRAKAYDLALPLVSANGNGTSSAVRRGAIHAIVTMNHKPAVVFTELTSLIGRNQDVATAASGLRVLPRETWPKDQEGKAALGLVSWAKTVPAGERTDEDYIETVQLASDLAGSLPADQAAQTRAELRGLSVPVFIIRTIREQMRYDTPRLVVKAGAHFEIRFENSDFMPHNLAIVKPGTREKVGIASSKMKPDELDDKGRAFLPATDDIIDATKLVEPGHKQTLKLTAPSQEGVYEYVCTYPNHYQIMWGQLIVTGDVEAYLRDHPMVAQLPKATTFGE